MYGFAGRGRRASKGDLFISCRVHNNTYDVCRYQGDDRSTSETIAKFKTYARAKAKLSELRAEDLKQASSKTKRGRQVYPSDEIPHLWMHKVQDSARNSTHTLYFNGDTIYSYGDHFPIARHVTGKGGKAGVLFNSQSASSTTSRHQGGVRGAIPERVPVFEVPLSTGGRSGWEYHDLKHSRNLAYFLEKYNRECAQVGKAMSVHGYTWRRKQALSTRAECLKYCVFFGIKAPKLDAPVKHGRKKLAHLKALDEARAARPNPWSWEERSKRRGIQREQWEKERQEWEAQQKAREEERERTRGERVQKWLAGESVDVSDAGRTLLRVKNGQVETSMGARVPVEDARRVLVLVRGVMQSGREYVRNGHTIRIGHYPVDKITAEGTLYAGCHVIGWEEIARIAPEVERAVVEVANAPVTA